MGRVEVLLGWVLGMKGGFVVVGVLVVGVLVVGVLVVGRTAGRGLAVDMVVVHSTAVGTEVVVVAVEC